MRYVDWKGLGMQVEDMTCELRCALAAAIVTRARPNAGERARLARDLSLLGFESMPVGRVVDMALDYGVPDEVVSGLALSHSDSLHPLPARYLCGLCLDSRLVPVEGSMVERFASCPRCNTAKVDVPFDPKADR